MTSQMIFFLQFMMSLAAFALIAVWYLGPWLRKLSPTTAMSLLILPHISRHIGMSFLVPPLNQESISGTFAFWAGYGDLASAILAFAA